MNKNFLFSDESASYRIPQQPADGQAVEIRFQALKSDDIKVYVVHRNHRYPMTVSEEIGDLKMYSYHIPVIREKDSYRYYFEITEPVESTGSARTDDSAIYPGKTPQGDAEKRQPSEHSVFYDKMGVTDDPKPENAFVVRAGDHIPDWLQGAVMYQIFVDRFAKGESSNDVLDREYIYLNGKSVEHVDDWYSLPETLDVGRFYGGDLQGVRAKLDYLQKLGIQVIYLNPIFVSPSNHKYDAQDYDHVDPHISVIVKDTGALLTEDAKDNSGAERYRTRVTDPENLASADAYFAELVEEIHARGMKIILDGVFNHCGSFNRWLDREGFYNRPGMAKEDMGAWQSKDSRYRSYFRFDEKGENYESWWDVYTLPKLNYEGSPALEDEIMRIAAKWVSPPFNVDGWRLDVAADLGHSEEYNHKFWKRFRKAVREANPDAVVLAEHYGSPGPWLNKGEWDTVMNYDAFMEPLTWFLTGMDKHSDSSKPERIGDSDLFIKTMRLGQRAFGSAALQGAMNQLDNHDHSRFLTRTNRKVGRLATAGHAAASENINKAVMRQAVVMQMTWPGAPTLYYGDEAGLCGWTDPDNRRTYPWGKEDFELLEFYRYVIAIHKMHPALLTGSLIPLLSEQGLLSYGRCLRHDRVVVIVNTDSVSRKAVVDARLLGVSGDAVFQREMMTGSKGYNVGWLPVESKDGILTIEMPPVSSMILWENPDVMEQDKMEKRMKKLLDFSK